MSTTARLIKKKFLLRYNHFLENLHIASVMLNKLRMMENQEFYWKLFDSFNCSSS